MANIPLKNSHFVSFNSDLELIEHDIHRNARYIYHASQDYFVQGKPNELQETEMRNTYKQAMKKLQIVKRTYNG